MKWTYSIQQKTTAAVLLAAIFGVFFIVNRIENNKITELGQSMNSVYEDRLLVENYIFRLSSLLYEKKILLDHCAATNETDENIKLLNQQNQAIALLVKNYEHTELTEVEASLFTDLKTELHHIQHQEREYLKSAPENEEARVMLLSAYFQKANLLLNDLSNVQISVGKLANERSKEIVAGSSLLTRFELAILIVVALLINALVFSSRSVIRKAVGQPNLN